MQRTITPYATLRTGAIIFIKDRVILLSSNKPFVYVRVIRSADIAVRRCLAHMDVSQTFLEVLERIVPPWLDNAFISFEHVDEFLDVLVIIHCVGPFISNIV